MVRAVGQGAAVRRDLRRRHHGGLSAPWPVLSSTTSARRRGRERGGCTWLCRRTCIGLAWACAPKSWMGSGGEAGQLSPARRSHSYCHASSHVRGRARCTVLLGTPACLDKRQGGMGQVCAAPAAGPSCGAGLQQQRGGCA